VAVNPEGAAMDVVVGGSEIYFVKYNFMTVQRN
jgi:hypothetical protein